MVVHSLLRNRETICTTKVQAQPLRLGEGLGYDALSRLRKVQRLDTIGFSKFSDLNQFAVRRIYLTSCE